VQEDAISFAGFLPGELASGSKDLDFGRTNVI
jgi:hypothetical protein